MGGSAWYGACGAAQLPREMLLIRNNEMWPSSRRLKLQQQRCSRVSTDLLWPGAFLGAFLSFFSQRRLLRHAQWAEWSTEGRVCMGKIYLWKEEDVRREISKVSSTHLSSGRTGMARHHFLLAQSTNCRTLLVCGPGDISLVQRRAWEARAASTTPSTIPAG